MRKILLLTVAFGLVATSAIAATPAGKLGLGFMTTEAPIGIRYMASEKVGIDLGLGFSSQSVGDNTRTNFYLNAALPVTLIPTEKANFNFVPGVLVKSMGGVGEADGRTDFDIYMLLEVEFFLSPAFAVNASHGLAISIEDNGDGSDTNFATGGANWTNFGFHFYLPSNN